MAGRLRLLTFDLDDTLWDTRAVIARAEARSAAWLDAHCPELGARYDREALLALRRELIAARPELAHRISDLRRESLRVALLRSGRAPAEAAALAEAAFEVFIAARHEVEPFAEAEAALAELGRHYALGVLTNGNADVRRLPIGRHFRFEIRAESIGISKPDPRHFGAALGRAGVRADEALHIGDHPEHDVAGALGAGMLAVWFNPLARAWEGERPPHAEFGSFAELPALVRRLDAAGPTG